jgi:hypothetical protein
MVVAIETLRQSAGEMLVCQVVKRSGLHGPLAGDVYKRIAKCNNKIANR